jgi:2-C-methyl-D-erythritol 4-phosphate cytidylyltransferase
MAYNEYIGSYRTIIYTERQLYQTQTPAGANTTGFRQYHSNDQTDAIGRTDKEAKAQEMKTNPKRASP